MAKPSSSLRPVIESACRLLTGHASPERGSSTQEHYHENAALLQQQIQQLVAQNQLLKAQSSSSSTATGCGCQHVQQRYSRPVRRTATCPPGSVSADAKRSHSVSASACRPTSRPVLRCVFASLRQNMASGAAAVRRWAIRHAQACTQAR